MMKHVCTFRWLGLALICIASAIGCGGGDKHSNSPTAFGEAGRQLLSSAKEPSLERSLGTIPRGSIGPFVAWRDPQHGLAAYVSGPMGQTRQLVTWAVGDTLADQRIAIDVPVETNRLRVRELGVGGHSYVALFTNLEGKGEAISLAALARDGKALATPLRIATTDTLIAWFEAIPTARGLLVLWVEETRGGGADVLSLAVERDGTISSVPTRIARNVSAWQATRDAAGATLALVTRGADKNDRVEIVRMDDGGQKRDAIIVAEKQSALGDIDIVRTPRGFRVAWTDRAGGELRVLGAEVDAQSRKVEPRVLAEARGGATLIALGEAKHGSVLLWDERARFDAKTRTVHLATLGRGVKRDVSFDTDAVEPSLHATDAGWVLLSSVQAVPTIVRTSPDLDGRVNLSVSTSWGSPSIAWSMTCFESACRYLAAIGDAEPRVALLDFDARQQGRPVEAPRGPTGRELTDASSFEVGEPIATMVATQIGATTLVAVLTQSVEDPRKPAAASKIWVFAVDEKGQLLGPPNKLTDRALSIGNVAIAPAENPEQGAVLAWVARDKDDPEVHISSVDARGKRTKDAQLTQTKGDASDVALAPVAGGFILAWVDGRLGHPEIFATKITRELGRIAREERITQIKSTKSDLSLAFAGDGVVLAWSDARDTEAESLGDIYLAKINPRNAQRLVADVRVLATAAHSRTPSLFAHGEAIGLAWIEEGTSVESSAAMVATFTAALERADAPARVPVSEAGGRPQSVSLVANDEKKLMGLLSRTKAGGAALDVIEGSIAAMRATALSGELGRPTADATVLATKRGLYFAGEGPTATEHRLHHGRP